MSNFGNHFRLIAVYVISILFLDSVSAQWSCNPDTFFYEDIAEYEGGLIQGFGPEVAAWYGRDVVVLIEKETISDRDPLIMEEILKSLDALAQQFDRITGRRPPNLQPLKGRMRIEINHPRDGYGAGGSHHQQIGIHADTLFLNTQYRNLEKGLNTMDHVFFWEMGRSWYYLDVERPIDYQIKGNSLIYGYWVGGFNSLWPIILMDDLPSKDMTLYSLNLADFETDIHTQYQIYVSDTSYNWENSWNSQYLPWNPSKSLNELMSGTLVELYYRYGDEFISGLWREIPKLSIPESKDDHQAVRDNFYIAASLAAKEDLISFFNELRWQISSSAMAQVNEQLALFADNQELTISYEPFEYDGENSSNFTGWFGLWNNYNRTTQVFESQFSLLESSLEYQNKEVIGGSLHLQGEDENEYRITRYLDKRYGCEGSSTWISFLVSTPQVANGACMVELGDSRRFPIGKGWGEKFTINDESTGVNITANQTYFVVGRLDSYFGNDTMLLWINPDLSAIPNDNEAVLHFGGYDAGELTSATILYQGHGSAEYTLDELKIGYTWEDVSGDLSLITDSDDIGQAKRFQINPNPICAGCMLNVQESAKIYDPAGRLITSGSRAPDKPGVYFLVSPQGNAKFLVQ